MPKYDWIKKTLILGSGAIRIGQAGEFDYSGSQALKALREENIETVLINPNIATIQTDPKLAGKVYLLPLTVEYVEKVIRKEKPDSILLSFGGQTGLNVGVELHEKGILKKYNIRVIGTPVDAIQKTEDRDLFKKTMKEARVEVLKSKIASSIEESLKIAEKEIGYPVIIRVAYTLGGRGSGVANNPEELIEVAQRGLKQSRINQILIEEYVGGWKEIEYEVVRDKDDNCITVCNMENLDPMGIHTGESIVVAPSQTLNNREYHKLRDASIRAVRTVGVIGECNIQYALDPKSEKFRAIEINARLSRSSALASKATGYPLAYIAAKIAIGYTLPELINRVTRKTTACFEPALDYITVKIPRWDLQKFPKVSHQLGPQMKSVGEVMAIGRTFEEAIQKATRMIDVGKVGVIGNKDENNFTNEKLDFLLSNPTDERIFDIVKALKNGYKINKIHELTKIDPWFLNKINNLIIIESKLKQFYNKIDENDPNLIDILIDAKKAGFSDIQIGNNLGIPDSEVRKLRKKWGITPYVKQIDTLAAEWPAQTNYLYMSYNSDQDDLDFKSDDKIIVLGSGTYRIGSSVEFDWCGVNMVWSLKKLGTNQVIIINCNPETVSTDYDVSDKLYFEELSFERVMDIYEKENPKGIIVSVGGQTPNNIAFSLHQAGAKLLGTSAKDIDRAENRSKFSALLDQLNIPQPKWETLTSLDDAVAFCQKVGYPVLIRPSYVLSGAAMRIAYTKDQLKQFLELATEVSKEYPVVISKFIEEAMEVEVDGICDGTDTLIGSVVEHIELAGIHSGDATMIIPPQTILPSVESKIIHYTRKIASKLNIKGPFNVQYLVRGHDVLVIECNLRASRSMPFVSKIRGINLMTIAATVILGKKVKDIWFDDYTYPRYPKYVGVKVPQFSFMRLQGADPVLGVEMMSTGEVACIGETFSEAFLKALLSAEMDIPFENGRVLITVGGAELKEKIQPIAKSLNDLGFKLYATEDTAEALIKNNINAEIVYKIREFKRKPNIMDYIIEKKIDMVINIPQTTTIEKYMEMLQDEYEIRCKAIEFNIPVITNLNLANILVKALKQIKNEEITITSLNEYHDSLPLKLW
jgi:carbamoyl-phosphate synthase large subunit